MPAGEPDKQRRSKPQRGFSLVEALIALVVLSIGLIGVAAMQLKALQSANAGYQRSVASVAAVDAQERLWAKLATLEPNQNCDDVDTSVVQAAWRKHWFQSDSPTPLGGSSSDRSVIESDNSHAGCRIRVSVALTGKDNGQFEYTFSLPRTESLR